MKSVHGDDETWIQTYTGRRFWPLDPRAEDVTIGDIAHALSNECRFSGHCRGFYSVAQHSVLVAQVVLQRSPELALTALLHDAAEAYMSDIARPVKKSMPIFGEMEHRIELVIAEKFSLVFPFPPIIKEADNILLATERRDLMPEPHRPWKCYGAAKALEYRITPWPPERAEEQFLASYYLLRRNER